MTREEAIGAIVCAFEDCSEDAGPALVALGVTLEEIAEAREREGVE